MLDSAGFLIEVDELSNEIKGAASESLGEEDLKIRVEHILRDKVFEPLNIPWGRYEYTLVSGVRPDALYGHVILEYEPPAKFEFLSSITFSAER